MPKFRYTQLIHNVIHFELIFSMLPTFNQPWFFCSLKLHYRYTKAKFVSQMC